MPMIQSKITGTVSPEKREALKIELGKAISILKLSYAQHRGQSGFVFWRPQAG